MNWYDPAIRVATEVVMPDHSHFVALPSYSSVNSNYPKDNSGGDMPGPEVYKLVGGPIYSLYLSDPSNFQNACALRVSLALNKSNINIPNTTGAFAGADGKNYFLAAAKLNNWMIKTFGKPNLSIRKGTFETQLSGKKGIYIMLPNYPVKFSASGHATLYNGTSCIGNHCYFDATGGVNQINLWILK